MTNADPTTRRVQHDNKNGGNDCDDGGMYREGEEAGGYREGDDGGRYRECEDDGGGYREGEDGRGYTITKKWGKARPLPCYFNYIFLY